MSDGPPVFLCDCGAEIEAMELRTHGDGHARWIPGAHVEMCRCPPPPRCVSCGHDMAKADPHPVCQRTDCALVGVWQLRTNGQAVGA